MLKIVFLDLEETVIEAFGDVINRRAVNHPLVRAFLEQEAPDEVRLFSFAFSTESDIERYRLWYQRWLNAALGVRVRLFDCFTTGKLFELCKKHGTFYEDEHECMLFHGKSYGFQRYIEMSPDFGDAELVLLDDAVEPHEIFYPKRNLRLRFVNVSDIC